MTALLWLAGCPWIGKADVDDQADHDGDGYAAIGFGGRDCDDHDPDAHPGAPEVWYDGVDQDCSGGPDDDQDGDGVVATEVGGEDCDDTDPTVGPPIAWHLDVDQDGYGEERTARTSCDPPPGGVADGTDCDDQDPTAHPDALEVCGGADEDCDGLVDDDDPSLDPDSRLVWYLDTDGDGFGAGNPIVEACAGPPDSAPNPDDCDDNDPARSPSAPEVCNDVDDDCDHLQDADDPSVDLSTAGWYADVDGDGFGNDDTIYVSCEIVPWRIQVGGDCDDHDPDVFVGGVEICDGKDDDCDGLIDDADPDVVPTGWYADLDGDGVGAGAVLVSACVGPIGFSDIDGDCDDFDPTIDPGVLEACNGIDDDCDGLTDVGTVVDLYLDDDDDGYGGLQSGDCAEHGVEVPGDCDDSDPTILPGATEIWYDNVDQNCDGADDNDQDGDGSDFPADCDDLDPTVTGVEVFYDGVDQACDGGDDYDQDRDGFDLVDDCDDLNPDAYPGAHEVFYDGIDQGCDGGDDYDQDGDGDDQVPVGSDCDDTNPFTYGDGVVASAPNELATVLEDLCDGGVILLSAGTYPEDTLSVLRPVTIRGLGASYTTLEAGTGIGPIFQADAPLTLEDLALTGTSGEVAVQGHGVSLTLDRVRCTGTTAGCVDGDAGVTIRSSSFSNNVGDVVRAGGVVEIVDTTFGPGDTGGLIEVEGGAVTTLDNVTFDGEDGSSLLAGEALVGMQSKEVVMHDVSWTRCGGGPLLAAADLLTFDGHDLFAADNVLSGSAITLEGAGPKITLDGLTVQDTVGAGTLVSMIGQVKVADRISLVRNTADSQLFVSNPLSAPVEMSNLVIEAPSGDGLVVNGAVRIEFATIVGAEVAIDQLGPYAASVDSVLLVGNAFGARTKGQVWFSVQRSLAFANDQDVQGGWNGVPTAADPQFVAWDPLLDPTAWDLHLRPTSPAVDAGNPLVADPDGTPADAGGFAGPSSTPWYADDLDVDGLPDGWEDVFGQDLKPNQDLDLDTLSARDEYLAGTSPLVADTDSDGILDWQDGWPLDPTRF